MKIIYKPAILKVAKEGCKNSSSMLRERNILKVQRRLLHGAV